MNNNTNELGSSLPKSTKHFSIYSFGNWLWSHQCLKNLVLFQVVPVLGSLSLNLRTASLPPVPTWDTPTCPSYFLCVWHQYGHEFVTPLLFLNIEERDERRVGNVFFLWFGEKGTWLESVNIIKEVTLPELLAIQMSELHLLL